MVHTEECQELVILIGRLHSDLQVYCEAVALLSHRDGVTTLDAAYEAVRAGKDCVCRGARAAEDAYRRAWLPALKAMAGALCKALTLSPSQGSLTWFLTQTGFSWKELT